jgi:Na+-translocating ferredoxin:NAD+ oxidoreductase subunit D
MMKVTETDLISPPHTHDGSSVTGIMLRVCLALVPALICNIWYFGWGIVIQCLLATAFAIVIEWAMLVLRGKPVGFFLTDGSVIVTALLFAFTVSPYTPWWVCFSGIFFAVVFAKHMYGGLGFNPFNPAMAGYVFVLLCFPAQINVFPVINNDADTVVGISESIAIIISQQDVIMGGIDALSSASPLNHMKSQLGLMAMVSEIRTGPMYGTLAGRGYEIVNLALFGGGILLLLMGVIRWRIPVTVLAGMFITSMLFYFYDNDAYASPVFHLFAGGTMLAAFFIATDPVTAPATPRGSLYYGLLIGCIAYIIRAWGGYPDGFAFAVLIANSASPLLAHYTRPRVLGESPLEFRK